VHKLNKTIAQRTLKIKVLLASKVKLQDKMETSKEKVTELEKNFAEMEKKYKEYFQKYREFKQKYGILEGEQ
jgi:predicted  nucleic acid-binding Zn-ribbon protein